MISPNAIERVLDNCKYKGTQCWHKRQMAKRQMLRWIPLDEQKDEPLPQWAIDILRYRNISYLLRFKMICAHHWDITGHNPDPARLYKYEMLAAPQKPIPDWLVEHRKKQAAIAKEYLERKETNK